MSIMKEKAILTQKYLKEVKGQDFTMSRYYHAPTIGRFGLIGKLRNTIMGL